MSNQQKSGRAEPPQRRSRLAGGVRSKTVGVKVTTEERERLEALARERSTTVPGLLLMAALTDAVEGADQVLARRQLGVELMRIQGLIGRTADNMNQVAKKANTVHEIPSDFAPAIREARAIWEQCSDALDQLIELNRRAGS